MDKRNAFSERVEITYLGILRIVVLVVATLFVVTAGYLLIDGSRRLATSADIAADPVKVQPSDVLQDVAAKPVGNPAQGAPAPATQVDPEKQKFDGFKKGAFATYYKNYVALAQRYNKPDDPILTEDQIGDALGYTLEGYKKGDDETVGLFVDNGDYAAQIMAVAAALRADQRIATQLARYKDAQKTAQACETVYEDRRGWDSNSTACSDWFRSPMGCPVIQQVPAQRCHPAYPEGITSPADAFAQMDRGFRATWAARGAKSNADAAARREKALATKASGAPMLIQAAQVFGAFLVVMFLFLVVAMERHLRRMAQTGAPATAPEVRTLHAAE